MRRLEFQKQGLAVAKQETKDGNAKKRIDQQIAATDREIESFGNAAKRMVTVEEQLKAMAATGTLRYRILLSDRHRHESHPRGSHRGRSEVA